MGVHAASAAILKYMACYSYSVRRRCTPPRHAQRSLLALPLYVPVAMLRYLHLPCASSASVLTFPQVIDELEPMVAEGGVILDWHTCEAFPERWVDLVAVLRCNHTMLWERLEKRCAYAGFSSTVYLAIHLVSLLANIHSKRSKKTTCPKSWALF